MLIQLSRTRVPLQYVGVSGAMAASAIFQMVSTTQGAILAPVMTTTQKNAIVAPATGLVVYDSTLGRLDFYSGVAWGAVGGASAGVVLLQAATPGTAQTGHINMSGTIIAGAFSGPLTGNVTGNVSGTAATVTGAAQPNITSLGTLTGLTVGLPTAGGNVAILATFGAELAPALTDGNWTVGAGWESPIVGPGLIKNADGTGTQTPSAATTIVAGVTYKVVITISALSVGNIEYTIGGASGSNLTAATTYTDYITANTTGKLIISPSNADRFTISAISIKALTDATGDLTISGNLQVNSPIFAGLGGNKYPGYSFIGYPSTGMYRQGNSIRFSIAGVESGFVIGSGGALIYDGTVSVPGLRFNSDANTGIYRPGADIFAIATGGVERVRISGSGLTMNVPLVLTPNPADLVYSGTTITGKNGEAGSMALGDVVYIVDGGTGTVPTFKFGKADTTVSDKIPAVAMCMNTITTGNTGTFLLRGFVQNTGWSALTVGGVAGSVWLSITGTTGNTWTQTKPVATGNIWQYLGCAVNDAYSAAHTGQSKTMFFNPSPVWVVAP